MSFSGVKTGVINLLHNAAQAGKELSRADVAASFQRTVVETLSCKAVRAAKASAASGKAAPCLALAGGVSANLALRETLQARCDEAGIRFVCPHLCYCTDNAAMVGSAAFYRLMEEAPDALSLNACPELPLSVSEVSA